MTEFRDLSADQETVNERDAEIPERFPNEILFNVNFELGENLLEGMCDRRIQEENNLLIFTLELKDITVYLLDLQLKLLELKHKKFKEGLKSCFDGLNNIIFKFQNVLNQIDNNEVNQLLKNSDWLTTARKELKDSTVIVPSCAEDEENYLDEMRGDFLKYQEVYKKCAVHIENFLQRAKNTFKISNVPREYQEGLCVLLSMLEENLPSYNAIFRSSKKKYKKFELILKNDMESSRQNSNNRINLFIAAIEKAEFAYRELKPILFEILNFEWAISGIF